MPETNNSNPTYVVNPKWPKPNQLVIQKRERGLELGTTEQIQLAVRAELEFGASVLRVQRSNNPAAQPPS